MKSKKGMFDNLAALAIGIIIFTVVIVVGSVVISNLGNAVGGTANTTAVYLLGKIGSDSGGLAAWTPAIIALAVGILFIGAFAGGFGRKKY